MGTAPSIWTPTVEYSDCKILLHVTYLCDLPPAGVSSVFYGTQPDYANLTEAQILAGTEIPNHVTGSDITIPFGITTEPFQIMWVAWPATDNTIVKSYINAFDFSAFGPGGTFMAPVQIGGFFYTRVNSATLIDTVILQH